MQFLQRAITRQIHLLLGMSEGGAAKAAPPAGPPFFPEGAACRRVHGDFTAMLTGGMSALLLQMLHPGALAGVWDHSRFRSDMSGRLRRTAQFVSATTYGSAADASAAIARVRAIHDRVSGVLPDGTPYSANDPDLVTWVHVAGVSAFLGAYLRYRNPAFAAAEQDRYFAETAITARALGAVDVPSSRREVAHYLEQVRPALRCDARTREVAAAILNQAPPSVALAPFRELVTRAAIDLLPDWAARMHGLRVQPVQRPAVRMGLQGVGAVTRWALAAR